VRHICRFSAGDLAFFLEKELKKHVLAHCAAYELIATAEIASVRSGDMEIGGIPGWRLTFFVVAAIRQALTAAVLDPSNI
jgi:hypothetical protein